MDPIAATATNPLVVEIDAPAYKPSAAALFAARSSKCSPGDMANTAPRTDGAAPPTADSCPGTFTYGDLIDTINPLQHIPLLSAAYRAVTGEKISTASNVAGGTIYGGVFGGIAALAGSMLDILQGAESKDTQVAATDAPKTPA